MIKCILCDKDIDTEDDKVDYWALKDHKDLGIDRKCGEKKGMKWKGDKN